MKGWILLAGLIPALPGVAAAQDTGDKNEKGWHTDYIFARDLARKTGKPMMVVFRCGP